MRTDLSIIILSYNTRELTKSCIQVLLKNLHKSRNFQAEVIVFDNASLDGSVKMLNELQSNNKEIKLISSKDNLGFAKGNNQALKIAKGKYILYLNSDVIVGEINFKGLINYLDENLAVGGLTVRVVLPDGRIDPASHRGFPTLSNSLFYFLGIEKITEKLPFLNKMFGGYHLTDRDLSEIHEIDAPTGAFFLSRKDVLRKVGGFDEDFFFYGEDIDLAFRIKKMGFKIIYYPDYEVLHLKHASSGDKKNKSDIRAMTRFHFYDAMGIFYHKHYEQHNSVFINRFIYLILNRLKKKYAQNRD